MKRTLWLAVAIVCLAVSLPLLAWGFWPPRRETITVPLALPAGRPSLPGAHSLALTFSPEMRNGDSQIVEMKFSTGEGAGAGFDFYEKYEVILEARLDLPFADVRPAEVISTALGEGGAATFYWNVNPRVEGGLRGTVWLYLRLIPKAGGEATRQPVSAQLIEIDTTSVLGRTGSEARVAGVVVGIVGLGLGILFAWTRRNFHSASDPIASA